MSSNNNIDTSSGGQEKGGLDKTHSRNNSLDSERTPMLNPYLTKIFDQNDPFTAKRISGFMNPDAVTLLKNELSGNVSSGGSSISDGSSTSVSSSSSMITTSSSSAPSSPSSPLRTSFVVNNSSKVISNKTLISSKLGMKSMAEDDESSSSEEEYESGSSQLPLPSSSTKSTTVTFNRVLLDLGDVIILKILGYLLSEDLCSLSSSNKYFCNIINSNQSLWKGLNGYYIKLYSTQGSPNSSSSNSTNSQPALDINLWEEEFYIPSQSIGTVKISNNTSHITTGSMTVRDNKTRSSTLTSAFAPLKLPNFDLMKDKDKESSSSSNTQSNSSTNSNGPLKSPEGGVLNIDGNVLVLNSIIRKLTPSSDVPSSEQVQEFIDGCYQYPVQLLVRKLLQRYFVPRDYGQQLSELDWQKLIERPIQLRLGKILRKVVDHKHVVFDFPSVLILKTFIKGYLQASSEMYRGLNQGLEKKLKSIRVWEVSRLNESLLCKVFRNFELVDLSTAQRVCKKWLKTINNSDLWEQLYKNYRRKLLKSFPSSGDINIWEDTNLNCFDNIFNFLAQTSPGLLSPPVASPTLASASQNPNSTPNGSLIFPPLPPKPPPLSLPALDDNSNGNNTTNMTPPLSLPTASITAIENVQTLTTPPITSPSNPPNTPTTTLSRHMNLNQLVDKLTSVTFVSDISEVNAFLATYRNFISTPQLVEKLLQRYHVQRPTHLTFSPSDWRQKIEAPIQHKVCKVLKKLIDEHFNDFNPLVLNVFKIFLLHIIDKHSTLTSHLVRSFSKKLYIKNNSIEKINNNNITDSVDASKMFKSKSQSKIGWIVSARKPLFTDIMSLPAEEIAKQLTLIEFDIFVKIQTSEFVNQAWAKEKTRHLAPNIRAAIDRFNLVTKWVSTVILKEEKLRSRTKTMSKFIKVAKCLRSYANYHTLMALLSGLTEPPIFRLKHTISELKPKIQKLSSELQTLMSVEGNHDAYRTELSSIDNKQSCIPYLGVFLKDITFLQDDSSKSSSSTDVINMKQSKNIYNVLKIIQTFQKNPYNFEDYPKLKESLLNLAILTEDNLHHLSISREPRNSKKSDIL